MPVARYFLFVGGLLLALLLTIDAFAPPSPVVASQAGSSVDKTVVRIRSDQKPPERVVFDTNVPTIVPPAVMAQSTAVVVPSAVAAPASVLAQANVRDTYAQLVPEVKKPEPRKRKVTKVRSAPSPAAQPQIRVAQQSHFGFFGGPTW